MQVLQYGTDQEATMILARLRSGESIDDIANGLSLNGGMHTGRLA